VILVDLQRGARLGARMVVVAVIDRRNCWDDLVEVGVVEIEADSRAIDLNLGRSSSTIIRVDRVGGQERRLRLRMRRCLACCISRDRFLRRRRVGRRALREEGEVNRLLPPFFVCLKGEGTCCLRSRSLFFSLYYSRILHSAFIMNDNSLFS